MKYVAVLLFLPFIVAGLLIGLCVFAPLVVLWHSALASAEWLTEIGADLYD